MNYAKSITISSDDVTDFSAYRAACTEAEALGYSHGSMSHPYPTALIKGEGVLVAKWKNLTKKERNQVDGIIEGDFRDGPVFIRLKITTEKHT